MNRISFLAATALALLALAPISAKAQDAKPSFLYDGATEAEPTYQRRWGISATLGSLTQQEDDNNDSRENDGNTFAVTADYYLSKRFAVTAGVYAEQTGMLTDFDGDGIGKKNFWMAGLQAGAKFYFFPTKWVVQPYVGGAVYMNVLNLGRQRGSYEFTTNDYHPSRLHVDYEVQCPAVSLAPQIGVDLRLLSSVSLTFAADYRWGMYGKSRVMTRYIDGPSMGQTATLTNPMDRTTLSLGLKIDFPMRPVNVRKVGTTICDLIYLWINGR